MLHNGFLQKVVNIFSNITCFKINEHHISNDLGAIYVSYGYYKSK